MTGLPPTDLKKNSSEESSFFKHDSSGIMYFDGSSPPLEVIDRIMNNFRYDPTRPKCTGYTNALEHNGLLGQPKSSESVPSCNSSYVSVKSYPSKTTSSSSDTPLAPIQEDTNNAEKMDSEIISKTEDSTETDVSHSSLNPGKKQSPSKNVGESNTACSAKLPVEPSTALPAGLDSFSETVSFIEDVKFLWKTPECMEGSTDKLPASLDTTLSGLKEISTIEETPLSLCPAKLPAETATTLSAGLDSSSENVSFVEGVKFLLKTPECMEGSTDELPASLDTTLFGLKEISTIEETPLSLSTPIKFENNESSFKVPLSACSQSCNPDENLEQLLCLASELGGGDVATYSTLDSSLIDSVCLDDVTFNDESTFASQNFVKIHDMPQVESQQIQQDGKPEVCGISAALTSSAINTDYDSMVTSKTPQRKIKSTSRRLSLHKGRVSVTKRNVIAPFKSSQNESRMSLRRSVRLSTNKLKAPAAITNDTNETGAPSVATMRSKGPITSKLPTLRQRNLLQRNSTTGKSTSVPVSNIPRCVSSAFTSSKTNTQQNNSIKPALPRQSFKTTTQQGQVRTFVSHLAQKSSIPQVKLANSAQSTKVRPVVRPAASQSVAPSNRTSARILPRTVSANRTYVNPYVSQTQLISAATPSAIKSNTVATKQPAANPVESRKRTAVGTVSKIPPPKKRNAVTKQQFCLNSGAATTPKNKD